MTAMRMGVQETPTPNLENNLRSYQTANPQQLMAAGLLQTNNQQNGSRASNQSRGQVQTRMMSGSEVISPQAISVNVCTMYFIFFSQYFDLLILGVKGAYSPEIVSSNR